MSTSAITWPSAVAASSLVRSRRTWWRGVTSARDLHRSEGTMGVASSHFPRLGAAASVTCVPRERSSARGHLAMPALATAQRNRQPTGLFVRVRGAEPHRAARARSRRQAETDGPHKRATDRECRGSAGGAWTVRLSEPDWSGFLPPPPRSVHAVLPHTAHQRPSPPAFGFSRPGLLALGQTTVPLRVIGPMRSGDQ
jgi:hypothetical protein